ncbi:hypothetical protein Plhal710r2_c022g0092621 [Plasmopara halstedii]
MNDFALYNARRGRRGDHPPSLVSAVPAIVCGKHIQTGAEQSRHRLSALL